MKKVFLSTSAGVILACLTFLGSQAQSTKLLRNPAASNQAIVFNYASDLWIVGRDGGVARRLTSSQGIETEPYFSPDGQYIAFTGNYSGNNEVYLINALGGEPQRLTWHPGVDRALGWTPDKKQILVSSDRASAPTTFPQLFTLASEGGLPIQLPIRSALRASFSASGKLLAYEDYRWQSEWKWYRGGQAKPIRIVSFPDLRQIEVPGPVSLNYYPAFLGEQLYFLSDRTGCFNIFAYDSAKNEVQQITHFIDNDIKSMSAGGGILVFERAGVIHTLDPVTGEDKELNITVHGDFPWAMKQWKDVTKEITSVTLSPNGARALAEARGEIFTIPAEKGNVRNLTNSSGAADRSPVWSPDGKKIAWFSDQSGEYKLMIADQNGLVPPKEITIDPPTFFFNLSWSPDSKNLAFTNAARELLILNLEKGTVLCVDTDRMAHPERNMIPVWAPDSKYIAYAKQLPNKFRAIMIYALTENKSWQVTDGFSDAVSPSWDKGGKYLCFLASTDAALNTGWLDLSSVERPQRRSVYLAVLAKDVPSPLLPESDEEKAVAETQDMKKVKTEQKNKGVDSTLIKIDFDGISSRILALSMPARNYTDLQSGPKGILFISETDLPFYPEHPSGLATTINRWDMSKRVSTVFLTNTKAFAVSFNGSKVVYRLGSDWFITGSESEPKAGEGKLNMDLKMSFDPVAEWKQIYREAWRLHRDLFYVPNFHGTDWDAVYEKYVSLLPYVRHRDDLNYLIDMMGGELAVGHHFVGGGDMGDQKTTSIGLLGADYAIENNFYRFKRILAGENWNPDLRAPLTAPGIEVHDGDYLLAVNGVPLQPPTTPETALEGLAGKQVTLMINSKPAAEGSRNITVIALESESSLRMRTWIEDNRKFVDKISNGTLAYVWLPNTGEDGYTYFNRYFFGQQDRRGVILDERFNGGGYIADYIIDIISRKLRGYFNNPVGKRDPWTEPLSGIWGPKVMLINEYAGSGGDMMPYMFRQQQLGPLVGTKTWGGLVGIWDFPALVDGGFVTVPRGGFFNLQGEWDVENKGIAPDVVIDIMPKDVAAGRDPQLEIGVQEALKLLQSSPVILMKEPPPPVRVSPLKE
jgi:tricorn protease